MEPTEEKLRRLKAVGLHYCRHYENVVRYNPPSCGSCPYATWGKGSQVYTRCQGKKD